MSTSTYISDEDSLFIGGVRSDVDPGNVPRGFAYDLLNATMVGGAISCRPGKEFICELPAGRFQGASLFHPTNAFTQILAVVSGEVYLSKYPFSTFTRVGSPIRLSPDAPEVYFSNAQQAVYRETEDVGSRIIFRQNPLNVLIIQDGAKSGGLSWDGAMLTQHKGNQFGLMNGGPMAWVGDRLWVARGKELGASDIVDPFSFREQVYLGGTARFAFSEDVVAMGSIPSLAADSPLLVWTKSQCHVVLANIRQRDQWVQTAGFVHQLAPIGLTSSRGVVSHGGQVFWMTPEGVVRLDAAIATQSTSKVPIVDGAMLSHKIAMPGDLSKVCGISHGEYMLMTVPDVAGNSTRTWVWRDPSVGDADQTEKWLGVWTGTNPVAWISGDVVGKHQTFEFSHTPDGRTWLWRNFSHKRLDDGSPILWGVRTRGFFGSSSGIDKGASAKLRLVFAKIGLTAVEEELDVAVYFAGTRRGSFKPILLRRYVVPRGSVHFDVDLDETVDMVPFKSQAREAITSDASETEFTGVCDKEDEALEDVDESFWLHICAHGPATIKWIRVFGDPVRESLTPSHLAFTDEIDPAVAVASTGAAIDRQILELPEVSFSAISMAQVSDGDFIGTGIGEATSPVSQKAAERVARTRATTAAGRDFSTKKGVQYSNLVLPAIPV